MAPAGGLTLTQAGAGAATRAELAERYASLTEVLQRHAQSADAAAELPQEVFAALRASGILGAAVAVEYGGQGGDSLLTNRLIELTAAADPSVAIILFQHYAVSSRISEWGSEAQRERYLPRLASGEWIAASAWSESGSGADKRNLATKARRTEGGGWLLEGAKAFTTGAGLADVYLVLAQTSAPTDGVASTYGSDGQTFFLIEAGNPGLFANTGMDLVGMRSSATGFVELTACEADDSAVLGPVGAAVRIIAGVRESGATLGAVSAGIAAAAYRTAFAHAQRRGLADQQAVRHRLVDLAAKVEAARALVDASARRDSAEPGNTTLYSKILGSRVSEEVVQEALRLLGSAGYLHDHPLNKLARDARAVGLMGPTNDLARELVSAPWTAA
jgi:alkylation response protein AidB-like acyl-CoA dehydrogenase